MQVELTTMVANISNAHEQLSRYEADSELQSKSMNHAIRDKQREFRDALVGGISRMKDQSELCLLEIRNQVVGLEDQVRAG